MLTGDLVSRAAREAGLGPAGIVIRELVTAAGPAFEEAVALGAAAAAGGGFLDATVATLVLGGAPADGEPSGPGAAARAGAQMHDAAVADEASGTTGGAGVAGLDIDVDAGRDFAAASMIKVPIAAALAAAWARGERAPDERARIGATVLTENDAASPLVEGYDATLEELARLMIVRSDNVATNALIELLDRTRITGYCAEIGLGETVVRRKLTGGDVPVHDPGAEGRNAHPPRDAARLFEAIALGAIPGSAWLEATLAAQEWNDKLSAGLAPGDRFAHKTGDTSRASHDGGILTTPDGRRFVVVVYTELPSSADSDARLGDFMRRIRPSF